MDGEEVGREQARLLRQAMLQANVRLDDLWMHYFSIGGEAGQMEVEAYLHHALGLPRLQRDVLAHALNELIDRSDTPRAPYAGDLAEDETATKDRHEDDDSSHS